MTRNMSSNVYRKPASTFGRRDFLRRSGLLAAGASAAPLLASCGGSGAGGDTLTVWWNQGFYASEDEAVQKVAAAWEEASGKKIDLQFYGTQDITRKEASAVTSGNVPDVIFAQKGLTPRYAWEGRLADVTAVVEPLDLTDGATQSAQLYNSDAEKVSTYTVPLFQFTVSLFHWRSMLEGVGMSHADAPREWNGYWQFWKQAQEAHHGQGKSKLRAIGWPMGTAAGDTNYDTQQVLHAYGVELLDEQNRLRKTEDVRSGIADSLRWLAGIYSDGYTPQGVVNWKDSGNNTYFLNRSILVTPNGSLSIPGAIKEEDQQKWEDVVTTGFPDRAVGGEMPSITLVHEAVVFEESSKKEMANDFLSFVMQPENMLSILKGARGRWFPVHRSLLEDPYFAASEDPNIQAVVEQLRGPTVADMAAMSPAYAQADGMQMWGNAIGRVVLQGASPEEGADFALSQLQDQFEKYEA